MSDERLNIYQRINRVMQKVAYVQKDKRVETYMAVTHDAVTAWTRQHFVEAGIVMAPTQISGAATDSGKKTKNDTPIVRYVGVYDIAFVNMDQPDDRIVVHIEAHAEDTGDKAPGKALSYATKYAVLKVLMLETGESDESRVAPEPEYTEEQLTALNKLREASLKGTKALEKEWGDIGKENRFALARELDSLKRAATQSEAA